MSTLHCDCRLEPVNDLTEPCDLCSEATETFNGIGWKIVRCAKHGAADDLLAALKEVALLINAGSMDHFHGEPWINHVRAAINKAEAQGSQS